MDAKVNRLVHDIRTAYQDAKIYLFGNHAKGIANPQPDHEFIIISKQFKKTPFPNRAGNVWMNTQEAFAADLLCYTPKKFEKLSKTSIILKDALAYAITV